MHKPQSGSDLVSETGESVTMIEGAHDPRIEPRCRVCQCDEVRRTVNEMLAQGASYAGIVRALVADDTHTAAGQQVTVDSVRRHCQRHFPVQQAAAATYREIVERRARENGVDFVDGVATAITPLALYEAVMVKGYETLVSDAVTVDPNAAMNAAAKLQAILDARQGSQDIADIMLQVQKITDAVRSTVPQPMWADILAKLEDR